MVLFNLFSKTSDCVALPRNTLLLHIGTHRQNKILFSVLNFLNSDPTELISETEQQNDLNHTKHTLCLRKNLLSEVTWGSQQRLCQFFSVHCGHGESWLHLQFQQQTYISFMFVCYQIIIRLPSWTSVKWNLNCKNGLSLKKIKSPFT